MPLSIAFAKAVRSLLGVAALLYTVSAAAAQPVFESWTTENGLPQNSVNDILQTRDGYLWLATFGGLVRFDGARFVVFDRSVSGIENQRVFSLHEDRSGTLWAGTDDGMLIRYRNGAFTTFTHEDGLLYAGAHRIEEDEDGVLWINSIAGITRYDGVRFVTLQPADFANRVTPPAADRYLDVWWRADPGGLHVLIKGRVHTYAIRGLVGDASITRVTVDRRGNLWINTDGGVVVKAAGARLERYTARDGLPPHHADGTFYEGGDGEIWFADIRRAYRIKDGKPERLHLPGLPTSVVRALYVDREGSTWIGTTATGLHRMHDTPVTLYDVRDGVSLRVAYAILQDRAGAVWISTNGLHRYANGRLTSHSSAEGLSPDRVTCLYEDTAGTLWVGSHRGLSRVRNGTLVPYHDPSGYLRSAVWAMVQDRAGTFWYATDAGLVSSNGSAVVRYTVADGLSHARVSALFVDRDGVLWIGTLQGLTWFANGVFGALTARDGFIGAGVRAIHQDIDGFLWIGTYDGGLYRLSGGRLTRFTRAAGLHDNGIFQILEDDFGFFWMGSNRGIQRISRQELNDFADGRRRSLSPLVLGAKDGLISVEVNGGRQPSGLKAADGTLWFPTMAGVAVIDPARSRTAAPPPKAVIEEIRVAGRTIDAARTVRVPPDATALEIWYTAPTFARPGPVRFRHRLVGLHDDWINAGERREAGFYGIPPGRYTFEVAAAGDGGAWSTESASIAVEVLPPFWRTSWFITITLALVMTLALGGHQLRVRHLRRLHALREAFSQRLIENQERERERISSDLHDSMGQSLRIIRKLARTEQQTPPGQRRDDAFHEIAGLAERVQVEMTEIAYDLRPRQLDNLGLAKTIESMIRRVERSSGVRFTTEIAAVDDLVPERSRIHVFRIVQEAVSNIVQHANASAAKVAVAARGRQLLVRIEDNGVGFSEDDPRPRDGPNSGFGLMSMRERARIAGGDVVIHSSPQGGSTISVTFTVDRAGDE